MARSFVSPSSQYLELPDDTRLDYGAGNLTICIWNRGTVAPANAANLVSKGSALQVVRTSSDKLRFNSSTPTNNVEYTLQGELSDGVWHHWVFERWVGTSTKIYLDGTQVAFVGNASGNIDNTAPMRLAARSEGPADRFWNGQLAEFASFKRVLSLGEIQMLARGFSPLFLRSLPDVYLGINGRYSPEIDVVGGLVASVNGGAAHFAHPDVIQRPISNIVPHAPARFDFLAANIDAVSSTSGQLLATVVLAGAADAMASVLGEMVSDVPLLGDAVQASGAIAALLLAETPIAGSMAAQSVVTDAPLAADVSLSGLVSATAALSGDSTADVPLTGNVGQASGAVAALTLLAEVPLGVSLAAVSSVSSATLPIDVPLAGSAIGTTTIAGDLVGNVPLVAKVAASGDLLGDMVASVVLDGAIASVSVSDAGLSATVPLVGTAIAGQSALTGDIVPKVPVSSDVAAVSTVVAGTLLVNAALAGAVDAAAALVGDMVSTVPLVGDVISAQSLALGDLKPEVPLGGFIDASSAAAGSLPVAAGLVGLVSSTSTLSGGAPFLADVPIAATSDPTANIAARLRVLGEILTTTVGGQVRAVTSTGGSVLRRGGS